MEGPAGGSLYVRDFARELARQGHSPSVYCRRLGPPADELLSAGIPVLDSIDRLTKPDIIHGNSPIETVAAMLRFHQTPGLFVCHGWGPDAIAPRLPGIVRYLAVSEHARDALISLFGIPEGAVVLHQNPVDLERFPQRDPLPAAPKRALVFSNTLTELNHLAAIQEACAEAGLRVDTIGLGVGTARYDPERILGGYDVVFAKGRAALEALATGCAVILADVSGFGEMVTTGNYELLRLRNFGLRTFLLPPVKETVLNQLKRYDPEDAAKVTTRVRRSEGLYAAAQTLVEIYQTAIQEFRRSSPPDWDSVRIATARFLDQIAPTSNTFHLAQQLAPVERRAIRAEVRLRLLRETLNPDPLSHETLSRIGVRLVSCPRVTAAGEPFEATVEVENGTEAVLASFGDYPLCLSYHWLGLDGEMRWHEGVRSEIYPPLPPGRRFHYNMRVEAPSEAGEYLLRLTLVQEHVAWLDSLGVYADTPCEVVGSAA